MRWYESSSIYSGVHANRSHSFFLVCLLITPLGFVAGSTLAAAIFSYPLLSIFSMQWAYFSSFIGLTMVISLISVWSFWNKAKISELAAEAEAEKAKSAAIERQALQAQLQMLQAQIEPHMLFNTLANLQGLIALDPPRAQHMLSQLIVYLRNTLSASRAEKPPYNRNFL
jgi:sensor histidine kinase YesM